MELFKSRPRVVYTNAVGDKVYPVVVDIKNGIKSTEDIQFVSSDVNTGILSVAFIQGNNNYNVTGTDVVCSVMRPDASTLELPCEVVGENIVEVPLGVNGTSQDGVYSFDFKVLKGGNKVVGTPIMNYSVSLSIGNDMAVEEDDRLPVLTMLMTQVNELKEETSETINQANIATEASKEATANAIEATNNANAVSERVSQETATAIAEIKQDTENAIDSINQSTSTAISTMNQNTTDAITDMTQKTNEAVTRVNDSLTNINNTVATKVAELDNAKSDMTTTVSNKVNEVETRFNALTSSQQQDAEVIDARDGETSLKARLDRDIEKAKQVYVNVEGSNISTDSSVGYLKDVEILGNTIQSASNLADIRSVGDIVGGQELYEIPVVSVGKNLFDGSTFNKTDTSFDFDVPAHIFEGVYRISFSSNVSYSRNSIYLKSINPSYSRIIGVITNYNGCVSGEFTISTDDVNTIKNSTKGLRFSIYRGDGITDIPTDILITQSDDLSYEPYQEDKLTILSPVQLEKVGDVCDRIIEKDGVWGVEKNIHTEILGVDNSYNNTSSYAESGYRGVNVSNLAYPCVSTKPTLMCNKLNYYYNIPSLTEAITSWSNAQGFVIKLSVNTIGEDSLLAIKEYIVNNNFIVKYPLQTPTFIPLPHDQQIKLRTFANKTNISFLTEIEGTIKAQVPKSLGATVNTHTTQISNLNKELDRVKKLEENTVSTVTTESDFTTVEATSNGYFEDVKLEGKTLVNKFKLKNKSNGIWNYINFYNDILEVGKTYTAIVLGLPSGFRWYVSNSVGANSYCEYTTSNINTFVPRIITGDYGIIHINNSGNTSLTLDDLEKMRFIILEGDHTQNPPNYFEGLKSVGDTTDEIVVSSVKGDGNLFDKKNIHLNKFLQANGDETSVEGWFVSDYIKVADTCYIKGLINVASSNLARICVYTQNKTFKTLLSQPLNTTLNISSFIENGDYIRITEKIEQVDNIVVCKNEISNQIYQSDKKRLLFYNNETQTWEKPILRQWDSIEKHANGKYYYHQRSGEVVLNGSENWNMNPPGDNAIRFVLNDMNNIKYSEIIATIPTYMDNNSFTTNLVSFGICSRNNNTGFNFHIEKSKLSTQDAQGFKQWLQANNVTVVYQLAQEKVYECTNIDLITYEGETNYIVECGAIVPRTTLKVHNNISNVVSLLQKKVSLLESNVKASQEVQDMMILETDMRMLDIELALMEFAPMKLNLGGSDMLRSATYFNFLKNHIVNETYEKEYLENVMNKYLATGRINQDEYDELYKMLYPPVYDIELPIEP